MAADGGPGDPATAVFARLGIDPSELRARAADQLFDRG